jgi:hypothetical protein
LLSRDKKEIVASSLPHPRPNDFFDLNIGAELKVFYPWTYATITVRVEGIVSESWTFFQPEKKKLHVVAPQNASGAWRGAGCNEKALNMIVAAFGGARDRG